LIPLAINSIIIFTRFTRRSTKRADDGRQEALFLPLKMDVFQQIRAEEFLDLVVGPEVEVLILEQVSKSCTSQRPPEQNLLVDQLLPRSANWSASRNQDFRVDVQEDFLQQLHWQNRHHFHSDLQKTVFNYFNLKKDEIPIFVVNMFY